MNSRCQTPQRRRITGIALVLLLACLAASTLAEKDKDGDEDAQTVSIKNMKFSPKSLTIKVGQTVRWKNADTHDHTVVSEDDAFKRLRRAAMDGRRPMVEVAQALLVSESVQQETGR